MTHFVDSSVSYAAGDRGEWSTRRAKAILTSGERRLTTDHILVECGLCLGTKFSAECAARRERVSCEMPVSRATWRYSGLLPVMRSIIFCLYGREKGLVTAVAGLPH